MGNTAGGATPPRSFEALISSIEAELPKTAITVYRRPGWPLRRRSPAAAASSVGATACWGRDPGARPPRRGSYAALREYENYGDLVSSSRGVVAAAAATRDSPWTSSVQSPRPDRPRMISAAQRMESLMASARTQLVVYGDPGNFKSFLEGSVLESVVPFLLDETLVVCMAVCPQWFHSIFSFLKLSSAPVVEGFLANCTGSIVEYVGSTLSLQPLFTAGQQQCVRLDCLVYARVTPAASGKCVQIGYSYKYANRVDTPAGVIAPPNSTFHPDDEARTYTNLFRFEALRRGASRTLWMQRDLTRFHGDEIMVAKLPVVPLVCVGDLVEIPVPLSHGFGRVDAQSVAWDAPVTVPEGLRAFGQHCEYENKDAKWYSLEEFQSTTSERLQINDIFYPQWAHKRTTFTGIDIAVSRSEYTAKVVGPVAQSRRWLGVDCSVVPRAEEVIVPLTRLALQHDRFNKLQARLGDKIILYIGQGGGIVQ